MSYQWRVSLYVKRREKRKLNLLYKIKNGISPDFLSELVPPTIGDNMPYNLLHNNDIQIPYCKLNFYKNSLFFLQLYHVGIFCPKQQENLSV